MAEDIYNLRLINSYNIKNVIFENLPIDKSIVCILPARVIHRNSGYLIEMIVKEIGKQKFYTISLPLKTILAHPLGMRFAKQKTAEYINDKICNINIEFITTNAEIFRLYEHQELYNFYINTIKIPDEIENIKDYHKLVANTLFYKIIYNNITVYLPLYEVARFYYFRSPSLTKRVEMGKMNGLYKNIKYLDEKQENGQIILSKNARDTDVADIFRFLASIDANNCMIALSNTLKNDRLLMAKIPYNGYMRLELNGFYLNHSKTSFMALQIQKESSSYPFGSLVYFRENRTNTKNADVISKKILANDIKNDIKLSSEQSNLEYANMNIYNNTIENRLDLINKGIIKEDNIDVDDSVEAIREYLILFEIL